MRYLGWCIIILIVSIIDCFLIRDKKMIWWFIFAISLCINLGEMFIEKSFLFDAFVILLGISIVKITNLYFIKKHNND